MLSIIINQTDDLIKNLIQ